MKTRLGLLAALLIFGAGAIFAAEGRKEIFREVVISGSNASGRFFISRNIVITDDTKAVIEMTGTGIEAVEIDLNGFTLAHLGAAPQKPTVTVSNVQSVTIRNGTLINGSTTQDVLNVVGGAGSEDQAVIEDVKIVNGDNGIFLDNVTNFVLQRNLVIAPATSGIDIDDSDPGLTRLTGLIADNVVREVLDGTGIHIRKSNDAVTIRGNHVVSASPINPIGIFVEGADALIVEGNNVNGGGTGIRIKNTDRCRIANNVVGAGNFNGLDVENGDECLIVGNVFSSNASYGIELSADSDLNHIERNNISRNVKQGIRFHFNCDGNTYSGNTLRRNDPPGTTVCPDGGIPSPCGNPAVCDETGLPLGAPNRNRSFGDNMNDAGGC